MKTLFATKRLLTLLLCLFVSPLLRGQDKLVVSQVYGGGGGGSALASYKTDFIEIFNAGQTSVSLSGYSLQYGSAGSSGTPNPVFSGITVLTSTATLAPGQYYLVSEGTAGTGTGVPDLPSPDQTSSINLAAASGKVALVRGTTLLSTGNACAEASIVSLVGYGSINPSSCAAGSAPTPITTVSASAIRSASCTDTGNNAADFTIGTPNPRRSTTTLAPCPPPTALGVTTAIAIPASVLQGNPTTLSVTVNPGVTSTGIAVTADLSSIGGSAAEAFTLSSTTNVYTYTLNVGGAATAKTYSFPVTVTDQQGGSSTKNIALAVQAPVPNVSISTLQSQRSTYVDQKVTTTGVVTGLLSNGFYIQTSSSTPGSTGFAEGIQVFTSSRPTVALGDNVTVTGTMQLYVSTATSSASAAALSHIPGAEITGTPAITVNSSGNPLPAPVVLPTGFPTATGGIYQLQKYEGMRVTMPSATVVGATDARLTEATETVVSTGQFYVVATGIPRPFREPGMDFRDFPSATCTAITSCTATTTAGGAARPANLTLYDDKSERVIVESSLLTGGTPIDVAAGAVLTPVTGIVDFTYSVDVPYGDPARILMEPATQASTVVTPSTLKVAALPLPGAGQFTVAAFNVERFFDTNAANDLYLNPATGKTGNSSAVDITADAYARRLKKFSLAVRTVLNNPDIISVEEVENLQVLKDMAAQIDADTTAGAKPGYVAYGTDSVTTFTNDVGGISIGFLVKPSTTSVMAWEQKGVQDLVPTGTALNDRPSQVLHAAVSRGAGNKPYPITVIANHLRSLNGIGTSDNTRLKKELQAEMLANLIQGYQANGEHVIAVGDMNAFQFSDGYTDTIGTITGVVGTNIAVQPGKAGILTTPAVNLINTLPPAAQQSYTEWGSAQVLDHAIVTADIAGSTSLAVAHIDADFPVVLYGDATTAAAISDHDPLLAYLALPPAVVRGTLTGTAAFPNTVVGVSAVGQAFTLSNTGEAPIAISSILATGDFAQSNNCGASLAVNSTCAINLVFTPTTTGVRSGTLTVTSTATISSVALTGTGLPAPTFTMSDSSGSATTNITVTAGSPASGVIKFTSLNGFAGSITLSCAAQGTAPTGAACSVTSPVTLAASGTATASVLINTTARTLTSGFGAMPKSGSARYTLLALLLVACVFMVRRAGRNVRIGGLLVLLFVAAMGVTGCGDGASQTTNQYGTAAGTYNYTVTAASGAITRTQTVVVTVQ